MAFKAQKCISYEKSISHGYHEGEFMGIAPTHKRVNLSGVVIHRIEDGKFAESWNEIDLLGIQMQLTAKA